MRVALIEVTDTTASKFEWLLQQQLDIGWRLLGPIQFLQVGGNTKYMATLVKESPT